jgi:hypothetical protein
MQNNFYIINECSAINIPAFSLVDSSDNPLNVVFPIPAASKSVRSLFYFYMLVAKAVAHSRYILSFSFVFSSFSSAKCRYFARVIKKHKWFVPLLCRNYLNRFEQFSLLKDTVFLANSQQISSRLFSVIINTEDFADIRDKVFFGRWCFFFLLATSYFLNMLRLVFINNLRRAVLFYKKGWFSRYTGLVLALLLH